MTGRIRAICIGYVAVNLVDDADDWWYLYACEPVNPHTTYAVTTVPEKSC